MLMRKNVNTDVSKDSPIGNLLNNNIDGKGVMTKLERALNAVIMREYCLDE